MQLAVELPSVGISRIDRCRAAALRDVYARRQLDADEYDVPAALRRSGPPATASRVGSIELEPAAQDVEPDQRAGGGLVAGAVGRVRFGEIGQTAVPITSR